MVARTLLLLGESIRNEAREDVVSLMLEQPFEQLSRDGQGMVVAHPQI